MGDFGSARQLLRSEWYWLFPQVRLPRKRPRAFPRPPQFPPRRTCCPLTSPAWLTACWRRRSTPHPAPRPRVPRRSRPPPRSRTSRSQAAARGRLPRGPSPRSLWHQLCRPSRRCRRLRSPAPLPRRSRQRLRPPFPVVRPQGLPRSRPPKPRQRKVPPKPRPPPKPRRRRRTRPLLLRQPRPAPRHRRPRPAPGAPRWRRHRPGNLPDPRPCSAWASASWHCPGSPASWSCGCAGSDVPTASPQRARNPAPESPAV